MSKEILEKASIIVEGNSVQGKDFSGQICVLTSVDDDGFPVSCVITPSKADGIKTLWLCTEIGSDKVKRIKNNNKVNISFSSEEYGISLSGEVEILIDSDIKRDMWYDGLGHHFKDYKDPEYCVLKFTTRKYSLFIDYIEVKGKV